MNRRDLLSFAPVALAFPAVANAAPTRETDRDRMLQVIEQLEAYQGWEASCVVAAKAFAAWQMRKALGFELPNPRMAQMHVDYLRSDFARYQQSIPYEWAVARGEAPAIAEFERGLQ